MAIAGIGRHGRHLGDLRCAHSLRMATATPRRRRARAGRLSPLVISRGGEAKESQDARQAHEAAGVFDGGTKALLADAVWQAAVAERMARRQHAHEDEQQAARGPQRAHRALELRDTRDQLPMIEAQPLGGDDLT